MIPKKNQVKPKNKTILTKTAQNGNFFKVFLDFSETILCKEMGFFALHSVHQDASFEQSKIVFGQFFRLKKKNHKWGTF